MSEPQGEVQSTADLAEGYPTLAEVLRGIANDAEIPDVGVERIEINAFASGDATYRVFVRGSEDALGGYLDQL